ncbi:MULTISPECIES: hypothetical protein [Kitasatospora]|uniref:Uncharacterized protein n=1 Tax=Kitasatospora cathayae TaxID=3004092 RepID=A0ABY7PYI1_9ACTN|nr:hypothetical protein [Kitasatospora sp. HUAS 3-15]WBP85502.1 hypothetical protein O1G21_06295 [Kitasatospora sp. HUAS 3-15]
MVEQSAPVAERGQGAGESAGGWVWLPVAAGLVLVGLVAVRLPVGVLGTLVRVLPAEQRLAEQVAPGVPWLPDLLVRGGRGGDGWR